MIRKIFPTTLILIVVATLNCFAQLDDPCDPVDNDSYCPLDTWVIALAIVAFVFAIVHLHRKRKAIQL